MDRGRSSKLNHYFYRQELNVSFLKGQKYKLQNKVDSIKNDVTVRIFLSQILRCLTNLLNRRDS